MMNRDWACRRENVAAEMASQWMYSMERSDLEATKKKVIENNRRVLCAAHATLRELLNKSNNPHENAHLIAREREKFGEALDVHVAYKGRKELVGRGDIIEVLLKLNKGDFMEWLEEPIDPMGTR